MTITLTSKTSNKYPRKLVDYLRNEQGAVVKRKDDGIYYIESTDIKTQLIVAKELKDEEAKYLKLLQIEHSNKELIRRWIKEYMSNVKNPLYGVIMNVLTEANPNEILEVYKDMGIGKISSDNREFIMEVIKKLELDKKLKEEGKEEGIKEGIKEGKLDVARNLLDVLDIETISIKTGLSVDEIKKLKK